MLGLARPACFGPAGATLTWAFVVERAKVSERAKERAKESNPHDQLGRLRLDPPRAALMQVIVTALAS
jgi:hypothetical protein